MSPSRRRLALALLLPALLIGAAGCGDDDDEETTPSVTAPAATETAPPTTATPTTTTEPTTTKPKTGGTPSYDPVKPDTPENDVPPPPGSPQEQFEQLCEQNPAACG
jgi:hypothetical protein